jgi:hypothetical protein
LRAGRICSPASCRPVKSGRAFIENLASTASSALATFPKIKKAPGSGLCGGV